MYLLEDGNLKLKVYIKKKGGKKDGNNNRLGKRERRKERKGI